MREDGTGPISRQACWDLLRTSSLGRVALSVSALPAILPVQYYLDGDEIAMCLGFFDIPSAAVSNTVIAFAADAIDAGSGAGWSVQVQGTGRVDRTLAELQDCGEPTSGLIVHLAPQVMTGYRVQLCPFVTALHDAVC
jgi:hypothetical protein